MLDSKIFISSYKKLITFDFLFHNVIVEHSPSFPVALSRLI